MITVKKLVNDENVLKIEIRQNGDCILWEINKKNKRYNLHTNILFSSVFTSDNYFHIIDRANNIDVACFLHDENEVDIAWNSDLTLFEIK